MSCAAPTRVECPRLDRDAGRSGPAAEDTGDIGLAEAPGLAGIAERPEQRPRADAGGGAPGVEPAQRVGRDEGDPALALLVGLGATD